MDEMQSFAEAGRRVDRVRAAMEKGMRDDLRFRMLVDSCVAMARQEFGPVDPEHADRAAYEHASFAAAMLLARVYDQDGEMATMRAEISHLRDRVLTMTSLRPISMIVPAGAVSNPAARLDTGVA